jgi:hypothetical protein
MLKASSRGSVVLGCLSAVHQELCITFLDKNVLHKIGKTINSGTWGCMLGQKMVRGIQFWVRKYPVSSGIPF